jgi:NADH:ubiquinone oxidoreductase subunit 3 (subunit A)
VGYRYESGYPAGGQWNNRVSFDFWIAALIFVKLG